MSSVIDNNRKQADIRLHKMKDLEQNISQSILDEQVPLKEKNGHVKTLSNGNIEVQFSARKGSLDDTEDISRSNAFFKDELENQPNET